MRDLGGMAGAAVDLATKAGAEDTWVDVAQQREVEFRYRDGKLEQVKDTTALNLQVRLYAGGRYATHTTTDLREDRLASFIREAVATTRALEPDADRVITPEALYADRPTVDLELVDGRLLDLDRQTRIDWAEALDAATHGHERLISSTSVASDTTVKSASASSNGFTGSREATTVGLSAQVTLRDEGDVRATGSDYAACVHIADLPAVAAIGREAVRRAHDRLGVTKGPTGRLPMVVDARAAPRLLGRLLGPANAGALDRGRSFWKGILGTRAFSPTLSITDAPLLPRNFRSRHYDTEGVSAKPVPIVVGGAAENLYVSTYYARRTGHDPTTAFPSTRVVEGGNQTLAELIRDVDTGIYVTGWLGGNADPTTGDYSLGLSGHLIEAGQIGRPINEMNVTGNLVDLFGRLEAVGGDTFEYSSTQVGSMLFSEVDFS